MTKREITVAFQFNLAIEKINLPVLLHYHGRLNSPLTLSLSPSRHKKKKRVIKPPFSVKPTALMSEVVKSVDPS
jgi:hypothetical protein